MSKVLEEQMLHTCNVTIAGTYTIFKGLASKLAKIAQIYALEQQIELVNSLTFNGTKGQILYKGFDIDLYLQQLEEQLKSLKDGKE